MMTCLGEGKSIYSKPNWSREVKPDNTAWYSVSSNNSEGVCKQNDIIVEE